MKYSITIEGQKRFFPSLKKARQWVKDYALVYTDSTSNVVIIKKERAA